MQNPQDLLDDWYCDTQEANPVTIHNILAGWDDDESVVNGALLRNSWGDDKENVRPRLERKNAFCFDTPQEAKKPALVPQVCFCIVFSCVLVFVS